MTGDSGEVGDETDTWVMVACDGAGTSNLDGVGIVFLPQQDTFTLAQAAAGVAFDQVVIVTADVPDVTPQSQNICDQPGPSGLYVGERVEGENPKGPPFPPGMYTVQVRAVGQHQGQEFVVTADLPITLMP